MLQEGAPEAAQAESPQAVLASGGEPNQAVTAGLMAAAGLRPAASVEGSETTSVVATARGPRFIRPIIKCVRVAKTLTLNPLNPESFLGLDRGDRTMMCSSEAVTSSIEYEMGNREHPLSHVMI